MTSDALVRLRAAGAYTYACSGRAGGAEGKTFCEENFLHEPTMGRALELRKQLARILNK